LITKRSNNGFTPFGITQLFAEMNIELGRQGTKTQKNHYVPFAVLENLEMNKNRLAASGEKLKISNKMAKSTKIKNQSKIIIISKFITMNTCFPLFQYGVVVVAAVMEKSFLFHLVGSILFLLLLLYR
jgi:hypothetical protein